MAEKIIHKKNSEPKDYFERASGWADDQFATLGASRKRYRFICAGLLVVCGLMTLSILILSHTREYIPLLVHHYDNGAVSIEQAQNHARPRDQAQIESELVRYIVNRESYDPTSFSQQFKLVNVMSDRVVSKRYQQQQDANNAKALINQLGGDQVRTIHIEDINFLDLASRNQKKQTIHKNLAEINFVLTDRDVSSGKMTRTPKVAIVSWRHTGVPENPEVRWLNWDGFTVTHYQLNQRIVNDAN